MENKRKETEGQMLTTKGLIIGLMTFFMLIPGFLVRNLIRERQETRDEAVQKIDAKWSYAQTVSGPVLALPTTKTTLVPNEKKTRTEFSDTYVTPETVTIDARLFPEERYYGIYKTILYKSTIEVSGEFAPVTNNADNITIDWSKASVMIGLSDLRGIAENIVFTIGGKQYDLMSEGTNSSLMGEVLKTGIGNAKENERMPFSYTIELKGSGSINFLPIGRTTTVTVEGAWPSPGFIGNYTPEYTLTGNGFAAKWQILRYNRNIPDMWTGDNWSPNEELSFGVDLVDTVDIYQQNMRSAKYSLMFIALTFVVFFFVEVFSRRRIHPIQYLLVGIALILFYSLLLSVSEPLGFGRAYLIASAATILLITAYASSIFRNLKLTATLMLILAALYAFLYTILQLENMALIAGSIGLFAVLGIIMYFSRRIKWYEEQPGKEE